jgi:hypothetical protein
VQIGYIGCPEKDYFFIFIPAAAVVGNQIIPDAMPEGIGRCIGMMTGPKMGVGIENRLPGSFKGRPYKPGML